MIAPSEIFKDAIETLREQYTEYRFFMERDVVWTVQLLMLKEIERRGLPYRVFNGYRMEPKQGQKQGQLADLAVLDNAGKIELVAEFKYEPSHNRSTGSDCDIPKSKFDPSRVFWSDGDNSSVLKDVQSVKYYVDSCQTKTAYSILIDEGGYHRRRNQKPPPGCVWKEWENGISILWRAVEE